MPIPPNLTVSRSNVNGVVLNGWVSMPHVTELYIEALLVDEELADVVWEAWKAGTITDS